MKSLRNPLALLIALLMAITPLMSLFAEVTLDAELDAALNVEGGALSFYCDASYPMAVCNTEEGRVCAVSTNQEANNSVSSVKFDAVGVEAGMVLSFDVRISSEPRYDKFVLKVNDAVVNLGDISGIIPWTTYRYVITEAGDYTFELGYSKDSSANRNDDTMWLDNIQLAAPVSVTGVMLLPSETEVFIGTPTSLFAAVQPENATNQLVTWASSDESVAVVSSEGVVTAVAEGECDIIVTTVDGGFTDTCHVTVPTPILPESVSLNHESGTIPVGMYVVEVAATVLPTNAYDRTVSWTSSDPSICTVDANGKITAVEPGVCTITATTVNGLTADVEITVVELESLPGVEALEYTPIEPETEYTGVVGWNQSEIIRFPRSSASTSYLSTTHAVGFSIELEAGKKYDFLSYAPDGQTRFDACLNIYGPGFEFIKYDDESGGLGYGKFENYTAPETGTYYIVVSSYYFYRSGPFAVRVHEQVPVYVEGIEFNDESVTLNIGGVATPGYAFTPAEPDNTAVTFASSDESIATVDENGVITGISTGTAIVTVTTVDGGFTDTIEVVVTDRTVFFQDNFDGDPGPRWTRYFYSDTSWTFSSGWRAHGGSGGYAYSDSFDADFDVTPDNWLVSRAIELPENPDILLSYFVSCDGFAGEHYTLYISNGDDNAADFTEVLLSETLTNTSYEERLIDLSAYAGQTVYLAWRHHECSDIMSLLLDTISISLGSDEAPEPIPGDVDGNGTVEIADAILALRCALGLVELTSEQLAVGDMNGDGIVAGVDAVMIMRIAMSYDPS